MLLFCRNRKRSCLIPLLTQQIECSRYDHFAVSLGTTFEADIFVVSQHLKASEAVHIIIGFTILTRHTASFATGYMHMLQMITRRDESSLIGVLFPGHVPEIAHTFY